RRPPAAGPTPAASAASGPAPPPASCAARAASSPSVPSSREAWHSRPMPVDASSALLCWYAVDKRRLPWRAQAGEMPDPYRVWLSEIMLQQTRVAAVKPYFEGFTGPWPPRTALAAAEDEEGMRAWAGLRQSAPGRQLPGVAP